MSAAMGMEILFLILFTTICVFIVVFNGGCIVIL